MFHVFVQAVEAVLSCFYALDTVYTHKTNNLWGMNVHHKQFMVFMFVAKYQNK